MFYVEKIKIMFFVKRDVRYCFWIDRFYEGYLILENNDNVLIFIV